MLKRTDKLPRGSYFYIAVGERFYGGHDPVKETLELRHIQGDPFHSPYAGASYPKQRRGRNVMGENWPGGNERWRINEARTAHEFSEKSWISRRLTIMNAKRIFTPAKGTVERLTGKAVPRLVDDVKDVKPFRRRIQAEKVCEELNRMYGELNVKITIKLHEGE